MYIELKLIFVFSAISGDFLTKHNNPKHLQTQHVSDRGKYKVQMRICRVISF